MALVSAVAFAGSTSLQHQAAQGAPPETTGALALVRHLLGRPVWLVGQALAVVGLVLHGAALHVGSIALVQPIVISGVVLAVPVRSALSRRWPWPREMAAVIVTAAGLTAFLVASSPQGGTDAPAQAPALVITLICVLLSAGAILLNRMVSDPTRSAFLLGVASGVLFGVVAGLMKSVLNEATNGFGALLSSWTTWALIVLGCTAVVTNQLAYRSARLSASMPVLNVVDGLVAVVFGVLSYREVLRHSATYVVIELLAFAAITVGLVIVAGLDERESTNRAEPVPVAED